MFDSVLQPGWCFMELEEVDGGFIWGINHSSGIRLLTDEVVQNRLSRPPQNPLIVRVRLVEEENQQEGGGKGHHSLPILAIILVKRRGSQTGEWMVLRWHKVMGRLIHPLFWQMKQMIHQ